MKSSRRDFVKTVSIGTSGTLGLGMAAYATESSSEKKAVVWPSDRINIAFAGASGQANFSLRGLKDLGVNIVALCDVDWN